GAASDTYRGVTGVVSGTNVILYATRKGGSSSSGGGEFVTLTDTSGYDGTISSSTTVTVLATASSNTAFRGIAFTPETPPLTPSVTNATTNEDVQTTSGLVVTNNSSDAGTTTHYKITAITNGTLFKNNGTTQINSGDFITKAEGAAGLKFTPDANKF